MAELSSKSQIETLSWDLRSDRQTTRRGWHGGAGCARAVDRPRQERARPSGGERTGRRARDPDPLRGQGPLPLGQDAARIGLGDAHHSKNTSRSNGQNRQTTFPMMFPTGTGPKVRESEENVRLSPMTKIWPSGTVKGYTIWGACG